MAAASSRCSRRSPREAARRSCAPVARGRREIALLVGGAARHFQRLRVRGVERQRVHDELARPAGQRAALRHAERVGVLAPDAGVGGDLRRDGERLPVGGRRVGEAVRPRSPCARAAPSRGRRAVAGEVAGELVAPYRKAVRARIRACDAARRAVTAAGSPKTRVEAEGERRQRDGDDDRGRGGGGAGRRRRRRRRRRRADAARSPRGRCAYCASVMRPSARSRSSSASSLR